MANRAIDIPQRYYVEDSLFPTDNMLEIPQLRLDMQPKSCAIPFVLFGEARRSFQMRGQGTLCFYTDDYRFNTVYEHPEKILYMQPKNIVEPNFSLYDETPIAFGMQQIYKKRWIGRAMQERGVRVFVDLCCSPKFYKLNLMGVPAGYHSFCTRGYSHQVEHLAFELEMAKMIAGDNELLFVCYGGGDPCKQFCRENGLVYVTPVVEVRNKDQRHQKMKEAVAFFDQEISMTALNPKLNDLPKLEQMMGERVEDFRQHSIAVSERKEANNG